VPERFIFRQVYFKDIGMFAADGQLRSKNHENRQECHQTSYPEIVERRGTTEFPMPGGTVVNDYVPFYFSPITAFTFTIFQGNVELKTFEGECLGKASQNDRAFFVAKASNALALHTPTFFSNVALNSLASDVILESNPDRLEDVVNWALFDEEPLTAKIPEIGYGGVCSWFHDRAAPIEHQNRKRQRMAEFLVRDAVPLSVFECVVVNNAPVATAVEAMLNEHGVELPVLTKPWCYF
jgi:hypothetical protein